MYWYYTLVYKGTATALHVAFFVRTCICIARFHDVSDWRGFSPFFAKFVVLFGWCGWTWGVGLEAARHPRFWCLLLFCISVALCCFFPGVVWDGLGWNEWGLMGLARADICSCYDGLSFLRGVVGRLLDAWLRTCSYLAIKSNISHTVQFGVLGVLTLVEMIEGCRTKVFKTWTCSWFLVLGHGDRGLDMLLDLNFGIRL